MLTLQQSFRNEPWYFNQISSFKNNRVSTCSILYAIIMMLPMAFDCSVIFRLFKLDGITSVRGEVQFFISVVYFCIVHVVGIQYVICIPVHVYFM